MEPLIQILREGSQEAQVYAIAALNNLATNSLNQDTIREKGGIQRLIQVLYTGRRSTQAGAAAALGKLAMNSQNQDLIRETGGIQPLIQIVREGSQVDQEYTGNGRSFTSKIGTIWGQ